MSPAMYRFARPALACIWAFGVLTVVPALAATPSGGTKRPAKVSFIDAPSSEKPADRKKRLKRECKGRPNAGACLGFTR